MNINNNLSKQKMSESGSLSGRKPFSMLRRVTDHFLIILGISILLIQFSCKKAVEVAPPITGLPNNIVYASNATAAAALTGIYARMMQGAGTFSGGTSGISIEVGLSADEFKNYSTNASLVQFYKNSLVTTVPYFWNNMYFYIYNANAALEGLSNSTGVTSAVKQQLTGEAKFIRAFLYFYLVNLYGDVPLITETNFKNNAVASRSPKSLVYQQIISDLQDAQNLLNIDYVDADAITPTTERVRPSKGAATALLARTYLYTGNYVGADSAASALIDNSSLYSLSSIDSVFLKNSSEAIWQLQPVTPGYNTYDGVSFILTTAPNNSKPVALSSFLTSVFEIGDNRLVGWVGTKTVGSQTYYYPYKYKVGLSNAPLEEYLMVLRLAEQYLIRAEARAQQNDISGSQDDLNIIRSRAGLPNTSANTEPDLLTAILHERQVELFAEWGHRWLDLKRTGTVDDVMSTVSPQKGSTWSSNWQLYPIPQSEISNDPNLTQNPGYN